MMLLVLIGLAAGSASALLAAGAAAGTLLAVPLFYLSPLPVMIAGIAFSPLAAALAAITGGAGLWLAFGGTFLATYLVGLGGPAFGLSYAALMARSDPAARDGLVWFPVGGLVLLAAGFATVSVTVALFGMAQDYEAYHAAVTAAFQALVAGPGLPMETEGRDPLAMASLIAHVLPAMAAAMAMVSYLACLYLAARAARVSGRLARPWPNLAAFRLPPVTSLVLAVVLALSMAGGLSGLAASAGAVTLAGAYALAGFAVVHAVTEGHPARTLILGALWVTSAMLGWPVLAMAILGFVDGMLDFRARIATGKGPPAANDR
ncbi:DUF2232 domain-containing protein [Xanthobacter autotrophicus]|uniref:DUF2232 domain-containing protein n=1 Tax=Xanthobacter autotrophicus TaxID=280 RepID=UPI0024A6F382|nr:DUF2232 domain-containing protein [Xanthobacter autotrophicus]MDI4657091.1 DUF2232 domain-containing protein [Xanthobacter autotrophicus]